MGALLKVSLENEAMKTVISRMYQIISELEGRLDRLERRGMSEEQVPRSNVAKRKERDESVEPLHDENGIPGMPKRRRTGVFHS